MPPHYARPTHTPPNPTAQLNVLLATTIDLQAQLKQTRWNVRWLGVSGLCAVFDRAAVDVGRQADRVAECISRVGGCVAGTVHAAAKYSVLVPYPSQNCNVGQNVAAASAAIIVYIGVTRTTIGTVRGRFDFATEEMLNLGLSHIERDLARIEQAYRLACGIVPESLPTATSTDPLMRDRIEDWAINGDAATSGYIDRR